MKRERHKWIVIKDYINILGDRKHHHVLEYEECECCGVKRELVK